MPGPGPGPGPRPRATSSSCPEISSERNLERMSVAQATGCMRDELGVREGEVTSKV